MQSQGQDGLRGAVSTVLAAGGREVLDQPMRFRSMLADVLGSDTGSLRDEQSALVSMVEGGVAGELADHPLTAQRRAELVGRLRTDGSLGEHSITSALDALDGAVADVGLRAPSVTRATSTPMPNPVAASLEAVLVAGGPAVLDQPARFRSMLADVLGADASQYRDEQATLVGLMEQGVGRQVLAGTPTDEDRAELVRRLDPVLALGPERIDQGIDALELAIVSTGMRTTPMEQTVAPSAPPTTTPSFTAPPTTAGPLVGRVDDAATAPSTIAAPLAPAPVGPPVAAPSPKKRRRTPALIAIAAFVVLGLVALVAVVVTRSDDPKPPDVALAFPREGSTVGQLDRGWEIVDGELVGTLEFTNDTSTNTSGRHIEAFPKSLVSDAAAIRSDPAPSQVLQADPVLAWDVQVEAGGSTTIVYRIDVPDDTDQADLETWSRDQTKALADYQATQAKKPNLVIASPTDGTVVDVPEADLTGTTDPGVSLDVNGFGIPVNTDGTWAHHTTEMAEGPNSFVFTARGTNGQTTQMAITVVYTPPAPQPTAPPATTQRPAPVVSQNNPTPDPQPNTDPVTPPPDNGSGDDGGKLPEPPTPPNNPIIPADDYYTITPERDYAGDAYAYRLPVLGNDTGPYNYINVDRGPQYGYVYWSTTTYEYYYVPYYNGYYTDSFTYYLSNTQTGEQSYPVTVYLTIYYNPYF